MHPQPQREHSVDELQAARLLLWAASDWLEADDVITCPARLVGHSKQNLAALAPLPVVHGRPSHPRRLCQQRSWKSVLGCKDHIHLQLTLECVKEVPAIGYPAEASPTPNLLALWRSHRGQKPQVAPLLDPEPLLIDLVVGQIMEQLWLVDRHVLAGQTAAMLIAVSLLQGHRSFGGRTADSTPLTCLFRRPALHALDDELRADAQLLVRFRASRSR